MSVSILLVVELEAGHLRARQQVFLAEFHKVMEEVDAYIRELE